MIDGRAGYETWAGAGRDAGGAGGTARTGAAAATAGGGVGLDAQAAIRTTATQMADERRMAVLRI